jgi:PAS domain S-box-containing protein
MLPYAALALGAAVTFLLFALVRSLASSRTRAEALARDITYELRESENHLAEAQRMAALGNWRLDVERGRMHWSDEALRLLGRARENAPGDFDGLLACIHADDRERLRKSLAGARLDAKDFDTELRLQGADGSVRWVHALGQATLDEHGRISRLRGTFMDVTGRKVQERRTELEVVLSRLLASPHATAETLRDVLSTTAGMYGWSAARLWHATQPRTGLELAAAAGDLPANAQDALQTML